MMSAVNALRPRALSGRGSQGTPLQHRNAAKHPAKACAEGLAVPYLPGRCLGVVTLHAGQRAGSGLRCRAGSSGGEQLTEDMVMSMKVAELKEELKARSLPYSGTKGILQERLLSYLKETQAPPPAAKEVEGENMEDTGEEGIFKKNMTLMELKELATSLGVPKHGSKSRLRERLVQVVKERQEAAMQETVQQAMQAQEWQDEAGDQEDEDYASWTTEKLRWKLSNLGKSTSGLKKELVARVEETMQKDDMELTSVFGTPYPWTPTLMQTKMTEEELCEGLSFFGLDADGERWELMQRLWPELRREAVAYHETQGNSEAAVETGELEWDDGLPDGLQLEEDAHLEDPTVVALICGGPSEECGISLASARTVMDNLQTASRLPLVGDGEEGNGREATSSRRPGIDVQPYYIDRNLRAYRVSATQLYSHTPEDFDCRIASGELPLPPFASLQELAAHIRETADVAFPVVHGRWGESGELAALLEAAGVPFVGTSAEASSVAFDKAEVSSQLQKLGYPQLQHLSLCFGQNDAEAEEAVTGWCTGQGMDAASAVLVVKPALSGSSIGVKICRGAADAAAAAAELLQGGRFGKVVIQPYVEDAMEFSICVVETKKGPIALLPTEIELMPLEKEVFKASAELEQFNSFYGCGDHGELPIDFYLEEAEMPELQTHAPSIFDYSLKYLPSNKVHRYTPARCPKSTLETIRAAAVRLFCDLGLRDCARVDGWVVLDKEPWQPTPVTFPQPLMETVEHISTVPLPLPFLYVNEDPSSWLASPSCGEAAAWSFSWTTWLQQLKAEVLDEAARQEEEEADKPLEPKELCEGEFGTVIFSDVNITSGMEQSSFLFQQAAAVGLSHGMLLRHLYNLAAERSGLPPLPPLPAADPEQMAVQTGKVLSLEQAKMAHVVDSEGHLSLWTPPPDHAWDHFRCDLEDGSATIGIWEHEYLGDQAASPLLDKDPDALRSFPAGWVVNPRYLNQELESHRLLQTNYDTAFPEPEDDPQAPVKVWVLMGGESSERQVSLMSGINIWLQLRGCKDVIVEPFLLAPAFGMEEQLEGRHGRLQRKNYLLKLGVPEDVITELSTDYADMSIQNPKPPTIAMADRAVWAVPPNLILRNTVEEVHDSCVDTLKLANNVERYKDEILNAGAEVRRQTQMELGDAEVEGVAGLWSSDSEQDPPEAARMNLGVFAKQAHLANAVVFLATHGGYGENGELQAFLEDVRVPFTGSGFAASQLCMNKMETAATLEPLEGKGICTAPKERVDLSALASPGLAADEYARLTSLLPSTPSLCIKPVADGCSTGVARIACEDDFLIYAMAVTERWPSLPSNTLSTPHPETKMPVDVFATELLVEPFVETDPIVISYNSETGASEIEWAGENRWIEVTVGIVGELGQMHALMPSITVHEKGSVLSLEEKVQSGTGVNLTPPPASIVNPEALTAARQRCELVADVLGISGVARIDTFMHADTGELVVIEVNTIPAMTPHTVLLHQALQEDPPMYPQDLFRSVVELALLPSPADPSAAGQESYLEDESWFNDPTFGQEDDGQSSQDSGQAEGWGWDDKAFSGDWGEPSADPTGEGQPTAGGW
eukprot:CAMPEP_0117671742 /NCGR_PEP_ID=MMETSP0804-20121206/13512_1 /TAXON_ID=1074897 /ORGANISM="Tetraselmis astigmatica, Strain CCMP880" /LENGTH=1580 /DNA_ID=CAMNT_0005480255 /DNA_START=223 /DNA_END=4965 /DNA_ORIENTATION=+